MTLLLQQRGFWLSLALSFTVAAIGGALTDLGPWYQNLRQPAWKPPDVWFGPIWTTIFTLAAVSGWWAWLAAVTPAQRARVVTLFGVNAALNIAWSALFFTFQRPDWALMEWVGLWLSVVGLIAGLRGVSARAAWLNLPYLAWVTVAGVLNQANVQLNGPF